MQLRTTHQQFVTNALKLIQNFPDETKFKRGVPKLAFGSEIILSNTIYKLTNNIILIASTTYQKNNQKIPKNPGIFERNGFLDFSSHKGKVKLGLLTDSNFENSQEVILKKLYLDHSDYDNVMLEVQINKKYYGVGEIIQAFPKYIILVLKYLPGIKLHNLIYEGDKTQCQKGRGLKMLPALIMALDALQNFHQAGFLHLDIAARNFNYDVQKDAMHLLDFGNSTEIANPKDKQFYKGPFLPEMNTDAPLSTASDVYQAGSMFIGALNIDFENPINEYEKLIISMLNENPDERPTLFKVITGLKEWLNEYMNDPIKFYKDSSFPKKYIPKPLPIIPKVKRAEEAKRLEAWGLMGIDYVTPIRQTSPSPPVSTSGIWNSVTSGLQSIGSMFGLYKPASLQASKEIILENTSPAIGSIGKPLHVKGTECKSQYARQ